MRVLFVPLPWPTHYFAMVGLAWACRLQGDEVRVAAGPGVVDAVNGSGMPAAPVSADFDFMGALARDSRGELRWNGPGQPVTEVLRTTPVDRYRLLAESMVDDLLRLARRWSPELVVWDPAVFAGPLVARALGVPSVRHTWGPDVTRLLGWPGMGSEDPAAVPPGWPDPLVALFARHGLGTCADLADLTVDICPSRLQVPGARNRQPLRYTPYNGPGVLPDWLYEEPKRPRVCLSWGTASTHLVGTKDFAVPKVLDALSTVDIEVVVTAKAADLPLIGEPPANARVVEQLPLSQLLPSCAAIVHQGGSGTVMTAAYHGVPQLAGGTVGDQEFNAARLSEAGTGVALPIASAGPSQIRDAVAGLCAEPKVRTAAAELREEMAAITAPAEVAARLRALVGQ